MNLSDITKLQGAMKPIKRHGEGRKPYKPRVAKHKPAEPAPEAGPTPPATRNWKNSEYKPSLAMRIAIERAHRDQPPLIMMTSNVRSDPKNWSDE